MGARLRSRTQRAVRTRCIVAAEDRMCRTYNFSPNQTLDDDVPSYTRGVGVCSKRALTCRGKAEFDLASNFDSCPCSDFEM